MFKVGDAVKTTEACSYVEDGIAVGTVGVITEILPTVCPYPYIVNFNNSKYGNPCAEEELEFA